MHRRKVILLELNEITWRWVDRLMKAGKVPTFSRFVENGATATPIATEVPPNLDPWISWTSVYTGRPQEEHGVSFLEQPPETVTGPKIWEIVADAGRSLGVYGSIMSWPPRRDVRGFWVPSTFSPGPETYPEELRPIQDLNLSQTRGHTPLADGQKRDGKVKLAMKLFKLGLRISTVARLMSFLLRAKVRPQRRWEKVSYQPIVNLDFFRRLYKRHRPDFATFHSNHVAHYQHRYWRAADPEPFLTKPSEEEVKTFGPSVEFGYRIADEVLNRVTRLADDDTVIVVASGLGAQPYVVEDFAEGRVIIRIRDVEKVIQICGAECRCRPISMMAPQWNLQFDSAEEMKRVENILRTAWCGSPQKNLFSLEIVGNTICLNVSMVQCKAVDPDAACVFPEAGGREFSFKELCATSDATPKQGYHDRAGVLILMGSGIRKGARVGDCSNLDIAPTILHLLDLPIPAHMKGRVLCEVLDEPPADRTGPKRTREPEVAVVGAHDEAGGGEN